ncbi:hypothetical protein [Mesorhizobium amorphae]|jgi:hypothetical protein|uniref:hypothetical protein n=1 Tax=Mesorhizobium amorphae TaxID=71433 RepID=UPI001184976B|nr:hypothetical protein [Mesorhizobium amorphae]
MRNSLISEPPSATHRFLVGRDGEGRWIARDELGLTGGVFTDKASAMHFAETESDHKAGCVSLAPESARLSLFN